MQGLEGQRPLEHGSTFHVEEWRINFFHVLYFKHHFGTEEQEQSRNLDTNQPVQQTIFVTGFTGTTHIYVVLINAMYIVVLVTTYCSTSTIIETRKQTVDIPVDWNNSTLNQDKIQLTMQSKSLLQNTVETRSQCKICRTTWISPWPGQMIKFAVLELFKLGPIFQFGLTN